MNQEHLGSKPSKLKRLMNLAEARRLAKKVCQSIDSLKDTSGAVQSQMGKWETMFPCKLKMSCSKSKETLSLKWATLNWNIRETRPILSTLQCLLENFKLMYALAWCNSDEGSLITKNDNQRWDKRIRQNNSKCQHKWNKRHDSNLSNKCSSKSRKERLTYNNFNYSMNGNINCNNNRYRPSPVSITRPKLKCQH